MTEKRLTYVTLTGIDEQTPLGALHRLADLYPRAEFGILYSAARAGRGHNRYPGYEWIVRAGAFLGERAALHVCGQPARDELRAGRLGALVWPFGRVQVNGAIPPHEVGQICGRFPEKVIITQTSGNGSHLTEVHAHNHALLVDHSGGRGVLPHFWQRPETPKDVGFAGGLTPLNVGQQLAILRKVARGPWWLDMESGLRDGRDLFDVSKAEAVLQLCA